jgi:hypothetical protein
VAVWGKKEDKDMEEGGREAWRKWLVFDQRELALIANLEGWMTAGEGPHASGMPAVCAGLWEWSAAGADGALQAWRYRQQAEVPATWYY